MKKLIKLAVIRTNEDDPCPFGLSIPFGCQSAGDHIDRMAPLEYLGPEATEEEKSAISAANTRLLIWMLMYDTDETKECKYANKLFTHKNIVNCNWGDTAAGQKSTGVLLGSPFYSKHFTDVSLDGLYSYPLGWHADYNISRNNYYGITTIQGDQKNQIEKIANDIEDAVEHVILMKEDTFTGTFTGKVCYKRIFSGNKSLDSVISEYDDISSWAEWNKGELQGLNDNELMDQFTSFRNSFWAEQAMGWMKEQRFPPVILVETKEAGNWIGDGRGRVSLALGLNWTEIPVIILQESDDGDLCFQLNQGKIAD